MTESDMTTAHIVVGVDGSNAAESALRWALDEAHLRGATVEAVHVWRYPVYTYASGVLRAPVFAHDSLHEEARAVLDDAVDAGLAGEHHASVVERVLLEGGAVEQLVQRAEHADLLVVGHRGSGGFAGLLLGSVAQQCSAHATCPVVIVRDAGPQSH